MNKLFALVVLAVSLATSAHANQLVNSSFEDAPFSGPPVGWLFDKVGWSNDETGPLEAADPTAGVFNSNTLIDGPKAAHLSFGGHPHGMYWIYQSFTTVPGATYSVTGYYSGGIGAVNPFTQTATWEIGVYSGAYKRAYTKDPAPGTVLSSTSYTGTGVSGEQFSFGWTPVNSLFTASETSAVIYLKYTADLGDIYNYWGANYDGFSVTAIPEPVFFQMGALVGMGGLGLLRLRRKA